MTADLHTSETRLERRTPALTTDGRALGLHRTVVKTSAGSVVVRTGRPATETATIMLHGAAGSWTTWTPLIRAADATPHPLSDIVAIDLPGWGESRGDTGPLTVVQSSTLVREVAESLGYRHWVVVGHSLGGFVALDLAARSPAQTDGVVLVSSSGAAVVDAIRRPVRGGAGLGGFAGMLLAMRALDAAGELGPAFVRGLHTAGVLRALCAPLFADPGRVHRTVIDALATEVRPRAFVEAARAAAGYDTTTWQGIRCPVRAIRGERDVFVGESDGEHFRRLIGDFEEFTLPGAGHFAAIERPERVREILTEVLAARA